jgi:hypothetical protein
LLAGAIARRARTYAGNDVFLTLMPVAYILPNLGKMISLFKNIWGKSHKKHLAFCI